MKITKMRLKILIMIVLITDDDDNVNCYIKKMNKLDENGKVFCEGQI